MDAELTAADVTELRRLHGAYHAARGGADYATSDQLRAQLTAWGALAPDYARWHPVFESTEHRQQRLARP